MEAQDMRTMSIKGQLGWAKLNPNRGKDETMATNKRELKDEVQRLTTYNTMVLDMLRELLTYHSDHDAPCHMPDDLRDLLKRAHKAAA